MSKPAISVIMLTYNRESMVSQAIESILHQTFQDFEFIIVDNGSTDKSGKICESYKAKDSRILVRHCNRGTIGAGRNTGLKSATGSFIMFIEDDDIASGDMLEFLYKLVTDSKADIAVCGSYKEVEGKLLPNYIYNESAIYLEHALEKVRHLPPGSDSQFHLWQNTVYEFLCADYQNLNQENKLLDLSLYMQQQNKFTDAAARQIIHIMLRNNISDADILGIFSEGYHLNQINELVFLLKAAIAENAVGLAKMLEAKIPEEYCARKSGETSNAILAGREESE